MKRSIRIVSRQSGGFDRRSHFSGHQVSALNEAHIHDVFSPSALPFVSNHLQQLLIQPLSQSVEN